MFKFIKDDKKNPGQSEEDFIRESLAEQGVEMKPGTNIVNIKVKSEEEGQRILKALEEKFRKFEEKSKQ